MRYVTKWLCLVTAAAVIAAGGCDVSEIYRPRTDDMFGAKISPKRKWRASGSVTNPKAAIDGRLETIARASFRRAGAELTIDLGETCVFQMIIIDHGNEQTGCARRVGVATSTNGRTFKDRHAAPGARRVTHILLPKPVLARYLRLKVITPGRRPWAVGEVYLQ